MEKQEANEILVSAMGVLSAEAEIEAQIAELGTVRKQDLQIKSNILL